MYPCNMILLLLSIKNIQIVVFHDIRLAGTSHDVKRRRGKIIIFSFVFGFINNFHFSYKSLVSNIKFYVNVNDRCELAQVIIGITL